MTQNNAFNVFCLYDKMYSSPDSHSNTRMEGKRERREVRTKNNGKNKRREGGGQTTNRKNEKENSQGRTGEGGGRKQKTQCLQITN